MKQFSSRTTSFYAILFMAMMIPKSLPAFAQVFDSGPSNSSLFNTVINLPPDPNIGDNESTGDSTQLNISEGGTVGIQFEALFGSEVNISGGDVGALFSARAGSEINISGGNVDCCFFAWPDSEVNVNGGIVDGLFAFDDSVVNISGGTLSRGIEIFDGSVVSISGGTVGFLGARWGSGANLLGTEFLLDGMLLGAVTLGETLTITERDVTLSGLLADGSPFSFELNSTFILGQSNFSPGATLKVTLVPEPSAVLLVLSACHAFAFRRRC